MIPRGGDATGSHATPRLEPDLNNHAWAWAMQLVWVIPVGFFIGSTLWMMATVPDGAQTQMVDGHCYRMETRRIAGMTTGFLYWEVACPAEPLAP